MMKKAGLGKVVHVRLSEEEFLALQAFSAKAGSSVSTVLRRFCREAISDEDRDGRRVEIAIKSYIGELTVVLHVLDELAHNLRRRNESRFDVLIDGMARLARLVSNHAVEIQAMCDVSGHRERRRDADDV